MVRVAVVGCAHGRFDEIYAHVDDLNAAAKRDGQPPVELLLCCGDVQCLRNTIDLECEACPRKYRHMTSFHEYYSGEKRAPVLTIVIGGSHEASNYLQELYYGGWIAPNMFYLGAAGVVNVLGLRIAGLSGIYDQKHYRLGHFERAPYTKTALYSVFHVRETEVFQLSHLTGPIDIVMSHDWPWKIENHGDKEMLFQARPSFRESAAAGVFGSVGGESLLHTLRPRHWFAGHMHIRFEAMVLHKDASDRTKFLALDKCSPNRSWCEVIDVESAHVTEGGRSDPRDVRLPTALLKISKADLDWVHERVQDCKTGDQGHGEWPMNFQITAPSHGEEEEDDWTDAATGNPQTDKLLELLELPHVVTLPYRPEGDDDGSDRSNGDSDDEWDRDVSSHSSRNDAFLESLESLSIGNFNF